MAEEYPRCPVCFSQIVIDPEEIERLREEGIYVWVEDPLLTLRGLAGEDYKGKTPCRWLHIEQLQEARKQQEVDIGLEDMPEEPEEGKLYKTLFSEVKKGEPVRRIHIEELRASTEKILEAGGSTKDYYFNYNEEGKEMRIEHQTEWIDSDLTLATPVRAAHVEDLRHPILLSWFEPYDITIPEFYINNIYTNTWDPFLQYYTGKVFSGEFEGNNSLNHYSGELTIYMFRQFGEEKEVTISHQTICKSDHNVYIKVAMEIDSEIPNTHFLASATNDISLNIDKPSFPNINVNSKFSFQGSSLVRNWTDGWAKRYGIWINPVREYYIQLYFTDGTKLNYDIDYYMGSFSPYNSFGVGHIYIPVAEFESFNRNIEDDYQAAFGNSIIGKKVSSINIECGQAGLGLYGTVLEHMSYETSFYIDNLRIGN